MCINAIALFNGNVQGVVKFHQCSGEIGSHIYFHLSGLIPNKEMACHIHEYGDESQGCQSLGGHWNPHNNEHGSMFIDIHNSHAGDLTNNIQSDSSGQVHFSYKDPRVQLRGDIQQSIIGRSVVIHDGIDDLGQGGNTESKKTGNAGERIACAIIGHTTNRQKPSHRK